MVVVNPGDPVSTLRDALDAYTTVQETMTAESVKLKDSNAVTSPIEPAQPGQGATGAVPS